MVLADTSIWIAHIGRANPRLEALLRIRAIRRHEFVEGELACGNLPDRAVFLDLLSRLPLLPRVSHDEAMALLHSRRLSGRGLGWVDLHLLAAALIAGARVWTLDRRLASVASELGIGFAA